MNPALAYEKVEEVYKNLFIARTALRKTMIMFLGVQYLFQLDDGPFDWNWYRVILQPTMILDEKYYIFPNLEIEEEHS